MYDDDYFNDKAEMVSQNWLVGFSLIWEEN
jgi:hypothetical protein